MLLSALPAVVAITALIWTFRRPQDLAIWMLILCSSFPFITKGYLLAYGQRSFAFRVEYALVFMGIGWVVLKGHKAMLGYRSRLSVPILTMVAIHLLAVPLSLYWDAPVGFGVTLKMLETYIFVAIFAKLTTRSQLTPLLHAFLTVAVIVSAVLLAISIAANSEMYDFIYRYSVPTDASGFDYVHAFGNVEYPKIWLREADEYMPIAGVMSFVLFLLKPEKRRLYGGLALFFIIRAVSSEQRGYTSITVVGMMGAFLLLTKFARGRRVRLSRMALLGFVIAVVMAATFAFVPALGLRYAILSDRAAGTIDELGGERMYLGTRLAYAALSSKGTFAWLFGLGGFLTSDMGPNGDINTPLLMIYKFGLAGLLAVSFLVFRAWKTAWRVLRHAALLPEEAAMVVGLLVYIVGAILGSAFRGFIYAEDVHSTAAFVILLAWVEVIHRNWAVSQRLKQLVPRLQATA